MKLFDRYEVIRKLGSGTAGQVFLCNDTLLGSLQVAVKVFPSWSLETKIQRDRLSREMLILRSIQSPYIVGCYDFHHGADCAAIVMEYAKGQTLRALIDSKSEKYADRKFFIAVQILKGLCDLHKKNIVHRDIKPANIVVDEEMHVKIVDLGLVTSKGTEKPNPLIINSTAISIVGTEFFLAPELLNGGGPSKASDVYAAAMVIFELLTGAGLFKDEGMFKNLEHKTNSAFGPAFTALPLELQIFISRCTAPEPKDRVQNAVEMLKLFNEAVNTLHADDYHACTSAPDMWFRSAAIRVASGVKSSGIY